MPPPPWRGEIESSCLGRKSSGEKAEGKKRGKSKEGKERGRGEKGRESEEGRKGREWKKEGKERLGGKEGKGNQVEQWEDGEGNQVSCNFIHPCVHPVACMYVFIHIYR